MRYRALDANGDYSFGRGQGNFLINSPEAVAQAVKTRLLLITGEWFLDTTDGTPYYTQILGTGHQTTYDQVIKQRILDTPGVTEITQYASYFDPSTRALSVTCTINTQYGTATITA